MRLLTHIRGVPLRRPIPVDDEVIEYTRLETHRLARIGRHAARIATGCVEFVRVYSQYSHSHPRRYAARIAFDIAFKGLPF